MSSCSNFIYPSGPFMILRLKERVSSSGCTMSVSECETTLKSLDFVKAYPLLELHLSIWPLS